MNWTHRWPALLAVAIGVATMSSASGNAQRSQVEIQRIILHSRHLGAHGLGYNDRSLGELSHTLAPSDIPTLISMLGGSDLRVDVEFGLASQCEAAIGPVREAAIQNERIAVLEADDIMDLIAQFSQCSPDVQARARTTRTEIDSANADRQARRKRELEEKAAEDARIQSNALKMTNPEQRKTLTRAEREEVFRRSIKAAGLENPQTPEQKALVDRMYRTMVLGEPSPPKIQ